MSKFYVGQRVRVRYCLMCPEYTGAETVITRPLEKWRSLRTGEWYMGYSVALDPSFCPRPEQLEPIVPPHEASQYSFTELMDLCRAGEGVPA